MITTLTNQFGILAICTSKKLLSKLLTLHSKLLRNNNKSKYTIDLLVKSKPRHIPEVQGTDFPLVVQQNQHLPVQDCITVKHHSINNNDYNPSINLAL